MNRVRQVLKRVRWVHGAPILAFVALVAWGFASPVGAAPDDDFHLVSIWCGGDGSELCQPGTDDASRTMPYAFERIACYAQFEERSAACQDELWETFPSQTTEISRGNFVGEYPPLYYAVQNVFAGPDILMSALTMRVFNAALFVGLATALFLLLPAARRVSLLWGWLVVTIPLGIFLIPSNNPSGWALMGVGTAFLALVGWFETTGRRRWGLGALYLIGVLLAAGARGDAGVYVFGATLVVLILSAERSPSWLRLCILPAVGMVVAVLFFLNAGQSGVATSGITSDGTGSSLPSQGTDGEVPLQGFALAAYNLLMLPALWTGVWGAWGLGWLDTQMPAIVLWASSAAFIVVAFAGLGLMTWRKAISLAGVFGVLVVLPVYVLTTGLDKVGDGLQARYLLPLIVLFAFVLLVDTQRRHVHFTRVQTAVVLGALTIANLVALQMNIRRYVTGTDQQGLNLNSGAEWWWEGLPLGPTAVWIVGSLAYAAMLIVLWKPLRASADLASRSSSATVSRNAVASV